MSYTNVTTSVTSVLERAQNGRLLPTAIALVLAIGLYLAFGGSKFQREREDGEEPPVIPSKIPFIGHMVGLLRWQVGYFQMLSSKVPSYEAFTLKIFANRIYVLADPSLIQAAYRNTKAFDFDPFVVDSSRRAFDIGEYGMKIIRGENSPDYDPNGPFLNGIKGDSFMNESHKIMVEALGPGPGLLELNAGVLNRLAKSLEETGAGGKTEKVGLYKWMRDVLTMAVAESLYGAHNPVADDPSLIDSLWNFEEDMALLMLQFLPTLIVPAAYRGRAAIKAAFTKFYGEKHHHTSSSLIRTRHASAEKWGFTADDIANFEISTLFLAVTNTVPTSFWLLANILADAQLLEEIRKEVGTLVNREKGADGGDEAVMDIAKFQTNCPLLLSSFRETLRLVDAATSVRSITQDIQLTSSTRSSYLLKKGNVVQLPSEITHNNPAIWGSEPQKFNPRRFLPETQNSLPKDIKKAQTQGYFPFGGGRHLCPGRHFATTEILAFVGAMVTGFVVEGVKVPAMKFQKLGTAVRKPATEVQVMISKREGWENVRWRVDTGEGKVDFQGLVGEVEE